MGLSRRAEMAYGLWALVQGMVSIAAIDLSEVSEEISADPRRVIEAFVGMLTPQGAPRTRCLSATPQGATAVVRGVAVHSA